MKKDDFSKLIKEIGSCEDITQVREKLVSLESETLKDYDSFESTSKELEGFKADNEKLRQANMNLFLQIGDPNKKLDPGKKDEPKELKFENLFDEKGELK